MKIIKVSTDLALSVHEFPNASCEEENDFFYELIGNQCDIYEVVMPKRLYTEWQMSSMATGVPGECVLMLADEEGRLKPNECNMVGSYLYMSDKHGNPIMGNILFVGEVLGDDGPEFCGIEDGVFKRLMEKLESLISRIKTGKEVYEL